MENILSNLTCPITRELLVDPILLPCCCNTVSRLPMTQWKEMATTCPICRAEILDFDPVAAKTLINTVAMIETYMKEQSKLVNNNSNSNHNINLDWKITIEKVPKLNPAYRTTIGRVKIINLNNKFNFKTLLIPVIDVSGSMAGNPINQAKYSLQRALDLTYNKSNIITNIISYCDTAKSLLVDTSNQKLFYEGQIKLFQAGGGTSFTAAFDEIIKVCINHNDNKLITSITIIFLTDGEDSSVQADKRKTLVDKLKASIPTTKPYVIHSVGFGTNHDYEFLNNLRKIGTTEGAYGYANPMEDSDVLSKKINAVLDVVASSSTVPLKLVSPNAKIISGENDKYWIDLTNFPDVTALNFDLTINDEETIKLIGEEVKSEESALKTDWINFLLDGISTEILDVSSKITTNTTLELDTKLHLELITRKLKSISVHLSDTSAEYARLSQLTETVSKLNSGEQINQQKLNDMQFNSKFALNNVNTKTLDPPNLSIQQTQQKKLDTFLKKDNWTTLKKKYENFDSKQFSFLINKSNAEVMSCVNQFQLLDPMILISASMLGRYTVVDELLKLDKMNKQDLTSIIDQYGLSPLDYAILHGFWNTSLILLKAGCKLNLDSQLLLRTCISNKYYNTASVLIENKLCKIDDDILDSVPTKEGLEWLNVRSDTNISYNKAILTGYYDAVEKQLNTIPEFSWKIYYGMFENPTSDQLRIIELLIKNKKIDPNEIIDMDFIDENNNNNNNNNVSEIEKTWPLFVACEKGRLDLFNLLIQYTDKKLINYQNNKGTALLWIAACNRHIDIVSNLLSAGADPNICNFKGDSPLIPCCQKGNKLIAEILLEAGIKLDLFNKNRDGPVLICCRNGQAEILEMILKSMTKIDQQFYLKMSADIDGFDPLHAATELDKTECIKVCVAYGADLETKTAETNPIISGATALHLACFYGRINSAKVLIDLGADLKAVTTHGLTPLHIAIKKGHINLVRYLLTLEKCLECLEITDTDNKLPVHYANMSGNEAIMEEFFTNKLAMMMKEILYADSELEKKCTDTLINYSQLPGCLEYDKVFDTDLDRGTTLLTNALINGNKLLVDKIMSMTNIDKPDDYGITPRFWISLINNDMTHVNDKVKLMIDNLNHIAKKSIQNKLLIKLTTGIPKLLEYKPIDSVMKMSDGYKTKVNQQTVGLIKKYSANDISLFGFIDKIKTNKMFNQQPDKNNLEYILFDAKIHIIKLIALGENVLEPHHILAIYLYTSNYDIFQQTNLTLTNWSTSQSWHPFVGCLYRGIELLPAYTGEVYRGVDVMFDTDSYRIGTILQWNTFSIASTEYTKASELIKQKKGIIFIIKSKTGRLVHKYTKFPVDSEVIFLPESKFMITAYYQPNVIALGQANIRTSTFAIRDADIKRAAEGTFSIIIELVELDKLDSKDEIKLIN